MAITGNVTKRCNSTSFLPSRRIHGGEHPHGVPHAGRVILPQFVELPEGERFFTISRTADRPAVNFATQDHRLAVAVGCEFRYARKIGYASSFKLDDQMPFNQIGINCHVCPRQACSQRAHQPVFMELPLDTEHRFPGWLRTGITETRGAGQ